MKAGYRPGRMSWESTEIVMLVQLQHADIPLFGTTAIHAEQAVAEARR